MSGQNFEIWEAMRTTKYNNTLKELQEKVDHAEDVDSVLDMMLESFVKAVHAEAGSFWYYDREDTGRIYPRAFFGATDIKGISLELGSGIVGHVIETNACDIISDCEKDERWNKSVDSDTGFRTKSMICVPLSADGSNDAFGAIQIINKTDNTLFDEKDLEYVNKLAGETVRLIVEKNDAIAVSLFGAKKVNLHLDEAINLLTEKAAVKQLEKTLRKQGYKKKEKSEIIESFLALYRCVRK